jgi:hypothetical protein
VYRGDEDAGGISAPHVHSDDDDLLVETVL